MREKIDPELKELKGVWNEKLEKAGLGELLRDPNEVSLEVAENDDPVEHLISSQLLARFALLPERIQEDIITDVKNRQQVRKSFEDISERVKVLISKGEELAEMDSSDSDMAYVAGKSEDDKLGDEEEEIIEDTQGLINRLEELVNRKGDNDEDEDGFPKETAH